MTRIAIARSPISRRAALWGMAAFWVAPRAWSGSYLDRAALLLADAARSSDYLKKRLSDRELAKLVHHLAVGRVKAASSMIVPDEVAQAHPHLLLTLENYERSAEAAIKGQTDRFVVYERRAREEERTLRGVLKQLGWTLPEV